MICNVLVPQLLWFEAGAAGTCGVLWIISILVNVGMWCRAVRDHRRWALQRDFLPSAWHAYSPTYVDMGDVRRHHLLLPAARSWSSCACFPFVPVAEVKELNHELRHKEDH